MNGQVPYAGRSLAARIARLVEERGWNQEDFARHTQLNRQTVRHILTADGPYRMRNTTIRACARALGLSVSELRARPLDCLLEKMNAEARTSMPATVRPSYDRATQPRLLAWLEHHFDRIRDWSAAEREELVSLQGTGGPLTDMGVEHFVELIERKRRLLEKIHAVAGTEHLDLLERLVDALFEKVRPYADRA
jgi:transcriptional regulator with XRE-family HTH domain